MPLDAERRITPDIVDSMVHLRPWIMGRTVDVIWSSQRIKYLYSFGVPKVLAEFARILRFDGSALISCPDLGKIASRVVNGRIDHEFYVSEWPDDRSRCDVWTRTRY